jgi:hypothetical protein
MTEESCFDPQQVQENVLSNAPRLDVAYLATYSMGIWHYI